MIDKDLKYAKKIHTYTAEILQIAHDIAVSVFPEDYPEQIIAFNRGVHEFTRQFLTNADTLVKEWSRIKTK